MKSMLMDISFILIISIFIFSFQGCSMRNNKSSESDEIPGAILLDANNVLSGNQHVWQFFRYSNYQWLKKYEVWCIMDKEHSDLVYLKTNGQYLRLNCPKGIELINMVLAQFRFTPADFNDAHRTERFLEIIVELYKGPRFVILSNLFLKEEEGEFFENWLAGTEKNEKVLIDLCLKPSFKSVLDNWKIDFNVLNNDGSVDRWDVSGRYYSNERKNQLIGIDVKKIKPEGTFFFAMF